MGQDVDTLMKIAASDNSHDDVSVYVEPLNLNPYDFMDHAYYGICGFRDGTYLTPHTREMFYTARRQTSVYKNYVRPILDAMVTPIFADAIPRSVDSNSLFADFINDVDNNGTSLDGFITECMKTCIRQGQVFVVMDNFSEDDMPETILDARSERVFPYVMMKTANDVKSYSLDKWGNLQSIIFYDRTTTMNGKEVQLFRKWDANSSQILTEKNGVYTAVEAEVVHGLGAIPVLSMYSAPRRCKHKLLIEPPLYDIARIALVIYNKDSEVRDLERAQSFSVLCVQSDRGGNLSLGSHNVIFVPPETQFMPQFISPNPAILVGLMVNSEKLRDDLYKLAEQNGVTAVKSETSGVAESFRFFGHETVLQRVSSMASTLDYAIFDLFCKYTNETPEYSTDYPTDFAPGNITVEVDSLDKYLKQKLPPKAQSLALKKWTRLVLNDQDQAELQEALDEIDEMGDEAEVVEDSMEEPQGGETGMTGETGMEDSSEEDSMMGATGMDGQDTEVD